MGWHWRAHTSPKKVKVEKPAVDSLMPGRPRAPALDSTRSFGAADTALPSLVPHTSRGVVLKRGVCGFWYRKANLHPGHSVSLGSGDQGGHGRHDCCVVYLNSKSDCSTKGPGLARHVLIQLEIKSRSSSKSHGENKSGTGRLRIRNGHFPICNTGIWVEILRQESHRRTTLVG